MAQIIDTPQPVQRFLPRMGDVHTIIRYITAGSPRSDKHIKLPEVKAIAAAGKKLALVHETWGDFAHAGHGGISASDGVRDGKYAREVLPKLAAPQGACVYFAVDVDATPALIRGNVLPYFKAVKDAFADGYYRVGVYGPGAVCAAVRDAGYADLGWLSNAKGWRGYAAFKPRADLVQLLPTHIAGGLDVDPNVAQVEDWGQFVAFADDKKIFPAVTGAVTDDGPGEDGLDEENTGDTTDGPQDEEPALKETAKPVVKSKIAWLTGALGGTGAVSSAASDPEVSSIFMRLAYKPTFWVAVGCVVMAGMVVYFRWRDHGRGSS